MEKILNYGVLQATRAWLDKKGFVDVFKGLEAEALLGKSDDFIRRKFFEASEDQAEMLCGLLNTARQCTSPVKSSLDTVFGKSFFIPPVIHIC